MLPYQNIKISEYDYELPDDRIARYPLAQRDDSKLLVYNFDGAKSILDESFKNINNYLPDNSLLILNNTRVIQARIILKKSTGASIEIFLLEPIDFPDFSQTLYKTENIRLRCLVGNAKKWKNEDLSATFNFEGQDIKVSAHLIEREEEAFIIELYWTPTEIPFYQILDMAGAIPLPPYLGRDAEESDKHRYQTIFSAIKGSVAAPTAGLHFTDSTFESLKKKNIDPCHLTLHVGAGTFKPVKSESIADHQMHYETISVSRDSIEKLLSRYNERFIPVGTTSVRTLESLYWFAMKLTYEKKHEINHLAIHQWDAYHLMQNPQLSRKDALECILNWMEKHKKDKIEGNTQMMIVPGYQFKMTDVLITNFHQPCSTLLLLVSAFTNQNWKEIYQHALMADYRFLSYGDSCLLFR